MKYEDFCNNVKENIREYLPEELKAFEMDFRKVESLNKSYDGLSLLKPGSSSAVLNMELLYRVYDSGTPMEHILEEAAKTLAEAGPFDTSFLNDYEAVKPHLFVRVDNLLSNKEFIETVPCRILCGDLVMTFAIDIATDQSLASMVVKKEMLEVWGVDEDQLYEDAIRNSEKSHPAKMDSLGSFVNGMLDVDIADEGPELYVLTNSAQQHGAACLFYPNLDLTAHGDMIALPSSIHEWILMPLAEEPDDLMLRHLEDMVYSINRHELAPEDRLSDMVYFVHADTNQVETARNYLARCSAAAK